MIHIPLELLVEPQVKPPSASGALCLLLPKILLGVQAGCPTGKKGRIILHQFGLPIAPYMYFISCATTCATSCTSGKCHIKDYYLKAIFLSKPLRSSASSVPRKNTMSMESIESRKLLSRLDLRVLG